MTTSVLYQPSHEELQDGSPPKAEPVSLVDLRPYLFNRELSVLEYYARVLDEALDENQPLLERVKFLSIFSSNLDEFFMSRVSGLKEASEEEVTRFSPDGLTPAGQLTEIRKRVLPLLDRQSRCLKENILPRLEEVGIVIASFDSLSHRERAKANEYFAQRIFPMLTPQGVDPGHPFPYISGLSLNLGLIVDPPKDRKATRLPSRVLSPRFVRIKIPPKLPRLIRVDDTNTKFILIEDLIAVNSGSLFPGMQPGKCFTFRVTRDADVDVREEETVDLLRSMEETLHQRRFGTAVRLEVSRAMPDEMVRYLREALQLADDDVYVVQDPLDLSGLDALCDLQMPDLKVEPLRTTVPSRLKQQGSTFDAIKQQDILLHHPYNSYSFVTDFIEEAARDENVVAIKMCLYRTGRDSPIAQTLIEASRRGKQVTVLIELKARFDEENNIEWAKKLEEAGVHVVYGLVGLKTHSKLTLIVRNEDGVLRQYVHVATGNYNPVTSGSYTDLGLLSANQEISKDATELFNFLTGFSWQTDYRQLMIAPVNMRERLLELIARETAHARDGRSSRIIAKINRLADQDVIRALYQASQAGVEIDLIVRGICMLRPGVPGLSENINVISIVGRLLEHSRIYYFANGGDAELYIGSADWMPRNFDRRVEVITPIHDPEMKRFLKAEVLETYLRDNVKARRLLPDGSYERIRPDKGASIVNSQEYFLGA
jgi:polyphosphate kinase